MNFTVILLLHINNKDMTIMIIKEGNVKIHLNFHYHDSTRSLMWVLFWTQWEHGLVAAGGGEEPSAVRRCGRYWASHPSSSRPSLSLSSLLTLTLPWTQAEAGLGWGVYSWVLASRRDLPHYQDLVPLYSSFQCCWISWLGPAVPGLVRADLVCDFWADLCNSWLTPITHGHCPARTAGNAAPVRGPGPGYT